MTTEAVAVTQAELLPCPWPDCTSQPDVFVRQLGTTMQGFVECYDCGSRGPSTCHYSWGNPSDSEKARAKAKSEAAKLWNTRLAQQPAPSREVEQLWQLAREFVSIEVGLSEDGEGLVYRTDGQSPWAPLSTLSPASDAMQSVRSAARHLLDMIDAQDRGITPEPKRETSDDANSRDERDQVFGAAVEMLRTALASLSAQPDALHRSTEAEQAKAIEIGRQLDAEDGGYPQPEPAALVEVSIPVEFYQWLYKIERDVLVWDLTPNEIDQLVTALRQPAERELGNPEIENEDGWSDWIHPLPGHLIKCCDCGLVHRMEFRIIPRFDEAGLNPGEDDDHVIVFSASRIDQGGA